MSDVHIPPAQGGGEPRRTSRRNFLRLAGLSSAVLVLPSFLTSCTNEDPVDPARVADIDLSEDDGLRNFAWVAAQTSFEIYQIARFYVPYAGITALETVTVNSLHGHAGTYKLFYFRTANESIPEAFRYDWSGLEFSKRSSFVPFVTQYQELLAGAYAWAIGHARDAQTATMLAKMGSVAGRQVAVIRDLADIHAGASATASRTSFASDEAVLPATGMQRAINPREFLDFIRPYILTPISVRGA